MRMECGRAADTEKRLIKLNDKYRYKIERFKRMEVVERYAERSGMKQIAPGDFVTIVVKK